MKTTLTIAGSDCGGGAGIQADIKTISALGVYAMSVITSVVAENTSRVISVCDLPLRTIEDQLDAVFEDIEVNAVKIGMLSSREIIRAVTVKLKEYKARNIVIDPVMYSKDGTALLKEDAFKELCELISISTLVTPNIPEAEKISGVEISTLDDMKEAARKIFDSGVGAVLVKGGHFRGNVASDILYDGKEFYEFSGKRIAKNPHGTGCTLSSAIAAFLARGYALYDAVEGAKQYITGAIANALDIGKGNGPTHHFYKFYDNRGETI